MYLTTLRFIITAMLALAVTAVVAFAQNESGRRTINKERFQEVGYWYDSTTAMYQH